MFRKVVAALVVAALVMPAFQHDAYAEPARMLSDDIPGGGTTKNDESAGMLSDDIPDGNTTKNDESARMLSDDIPGRGTTKNDKSAGMLSDDIPNGNTTSNDVSGGDAEPQKVEKPVAPPGVTTKAAWSKCAIDAPQAATAGAGFKIRIVGDRQDEKGKYDGETKFVPASWEIKGSPFGGYVSEKPFVSPYESLISLKNAGTYTITAKYKSFTYMSDAGWTEDAVDFEYTKNATVNVPLTVVFNARGGRVSLSSKQYFLTEACGAFPSPSRKGHRFIGWYRTPNGEAGDLVMKNDSVATLNTSKAATVTLYAHYSKSVKVRFNPNGGKVKKKTKRITYVTAFDKRAYGKLPRPTRKGYYFAGWYTKKKGGKYISAYSDVRSAKNLTLYAHWLR